MIANPNLENMDGNYGFKLGATREDLKQVLSFSKAITTEVSRIVDEMNKRESSSASEAVADLAKLSIHVRNFASHVRLTGRYEKDRNMLIATDELVKTVDAARRDVQQLSMLLMNENKHGV